MNTRERKLELPINIERYLAALSKLYAQNGLAELEEIIVNAQIRVHEEWSYDNWDGGTYGHALYLVIPEILYFKVVNYKDDMQQRIKEDINKIHNVHNEFIEEVFLELELVGDHEWRKNSGRLLSVRRVVTQDAIERIWTSGGYRVFLSHKTEVKQETSELKLNLKNYGLSCFVAHEDIHPTKEWQSEIENALSSMDAFVALMTEGFHDSDWTDQEIGFALGRGVPIIAVRLGRDPYGFIGKIQALSCAWQTAAIDITKILIRHKPMLNAFINTIRECQSYSHANILAVMLPFINDLSNDEAALLVSAYENNSQVRDSYGFNGKKPSLYGRGLAYYLKELTGNNYDL